MQPTPADKSIDPFIAKKTRTLADAAQAAFEVAAAEHLPICATYCGDPEHWHREMILKTVAVFGVRDHRSEQVPATARLYGDRAVLDIGEWSDLTVKGADFRRYLEWLRSVW